MKTLIIGLLIAVYVIPFIYMLLADVADIYKRLVEVFSLKLKRAMVVLIRSYID